VVLVKPFRVTVKELTELDLAVFIVVDLLQFLPGSILCMVSSATSPAIDLPIHT